MTDENAYVSWLQIADTDTCLHGLNVPSDHSFVAAVAMAKLGFFPFINSSDTATCNVETLTKFYRANSDAEWKLAAGVAWKIHAISFKRERDLDLAEMEWGPLPSTLIVGQPNGGIIALFSGLPDDPDLRGRLRGLAAKFRTWIPLPGCADPNGGRFHWLPNYGPGEVELQALPPTWRDSTRPMHLASIHSIHDSHRAYRESREQ